MGGVIFRVGRQDETLATHGITHVVEHLALGPLASARLDMNGHVGSLVTHLQVAGTQERVEWFMGEVCRSVTALPLDRLELERRILLTESRGRGVSFGETSSTRFGATGIGLSDWAEMGFHALTAEQVDAWRSAFFTRGNAVAWVTRPPTGALMLELPSGPKLPVPEPRPLPDLVLPSHTHVDDLVVGCSLFARRSMPLFVAMWVVRDRLFSTLRLERALCYSVFADDDRVGATESLFLAGCDIAEGHEVEAVHAFGGVLDAVAGGAVDADEVDRACAASMPWGSSDPSRPAAEAMRKAVGDLLGHAPATWAELEAEAADLDVSAVAAALEHALGHALFVVPQGVEDLPERFADEPGAPSGRRVDGRVYVRWDGNTLDEVVLGSDGVSRAVGLQDVSTVSFDECVLAAFVPTGTIWLVNARGQSVILEPNQLMHGRELASEIRERLSDRVVDLKGDALGWFELQTKVEEHDSSSVKAMWRELETLAEMREIGERILLLAFADHGKRGILAITDRRLIHVSHARKDGPIVVIPRDDVRSAQMTTGIRGVRLSIQLDMFRFESFDRIRPRSSAQECVRLLTPIDDPNGEPSATTSDAPRGRGIDSIP
jgi:hypothetical protein